MLREIQDLGVFRRSSSNCFALVTFGEYKLTLFEKSSHLYLIHVFVCKYACVHLSCCLDVNMFVFVSEWDLHLINKLKGVVIGKV